MQMDSWRYLHIDLSDLLNKTDSSTKSSTLQLILLKLNNDVHDIFLIFSPFTCPSPKFTFGFGLKCFLPFGKNQILTYSSFNLRQPAMI